MILALAGNPNCGKTTLFNALTGANARTGNFPGVTVTRSESVCRARPEITLACNTPEASSRIVKGILRTMSQDQKQRLATKIVNANREKLMRKLNEYAAGKGIDVHICDCAATFR